ncbi:uncharacterized protein TRAVEDRAFT_54796 [Trametes versicolor FP-101664 SS1]|uniref:Uncharacterized protein n=1 Tax=Trametes versicolor (strain FP-101664) TaxID=717944 RepID=R7S8B4_TRAVS|nr:uncharacterized protein TRAVEDRAFT_54796 [Trametes versicolor FP-101664 SS1]EIW51194.1 hypothetical protein TRAVEDRAFT_54796 [Trametes versicolor FP-101664 SS1]
MGKELCNTRLCAYAYVGYKRPGFVCGTPLHGPRDGSTKENLQIASYGLMRNESRPHRHLPGPSYRTANRL